MNKVIMISGASRGIGRHIAQRLHSDGYLLALGIRDSAVLEDSSLVAGETVDHFPWQAADPASSHDWVEQVQTRFGRIDALINNAGVLRRYQIEDEDESALDEMLEVNLKGPLRLTRAALPLLRQSGSGRIVNLVSMSGKRVKGISAGYNMSKYAQLALTHATRNLGWDDGIRVTAVCPSWVNTEMAEVSSVPPQEMTQPEDVARLVQTIIELPNTAHLNEVTVNCNLET